MLCDDLSQFKSHQLAPTSIINIKSLMVFGQVNYNVIAVRDVARLGQKQAMPASNFIKYFGAKTCEFSHLPALTQNRDYATDLTSFIFHISQLPF